jgi:hypothetical protein
MEPIEWKSPYIKPKEAVAPTAKPMTLVEELKATSAKSFGSWPWELCLRAAKEIEDLQAALREIAKLSDGGSIGAIALRALAKVIK